MCKALAVLLKETFSRTAAFSLDSPDESMVRRYWHLFFEITSCLRRIYLTKYFRHQDTKTRSLIIRFFSNLVEESLVNFQCKISQVMKAVGFTFNDFDFVINPLQFTGMDWIFTMVQDAIAMTFKHFYEAI